MTGWIKVPDTFISPRGMTFHELLLWLPLAWMHNILDSQSLVNKKTGDCP